MPNIDLAEAGRTIPLGRLSRPSDIGNIAVFLASELASYVTGQVIYADGGLSALLPGTRTGDHPSVQFGRDYLA